MFTFLFRFFTTIEGVCVHVVLVGTCQAERPRGTLKGVETMKLTENGPE